MKTIIQKVIVPVISILFFSSILLVHCKRTDSAEIEQKQKEAFLKNCSVCHSVKPPAKNAPHVMAVFNHYNAETKYQNEFVQAVISYVENPQKEKSKLPEAIQVYGIKPKMTFEQKSLKLAAEYFYLAGSQVKPEPVPTEIREDAPSGEKLFITRCSICHQMSPPPTNGPPARGIARHYILEYPEKKDFKQAIKNFLNKPSQEKAIFSHAVERWGLMPQMVFDPDEIDAITEWLYDSMASPLKHQMRKRQRQGQQNW